jgi:hypothetical protein
MHFDKSTFDFWKPFAQVSHFLSAKAKPVLHSTHESVWSYLLQLGVDKKHFPV